LGLFVVITEISKQSNDELVAHATGGGAFKFSSQFEQKNIKVRKVDEMLALITGLNFLLKNLKDETFIYTKEQQKSYIPMLVRRIVTYVSVDSLLTCFFVILLII